MKAQGVDRGTLVFRSPFQPYTAWATLGFFVLVILFNGFKPFTETKGGWGSDQLTDFFTAYTGVAVFFLLYIVWKVLKRDPLIKPAAADIWTGKAGTFFLPFFFFNFVSFAETLLTNEVQRSMRRFGLSRFPVIGLRSFGSGCARERERERVRVEGGECLRRLYVPTDGCHGWVDAIEKREKMGPCAWMVDAALVLRSIYAAIYI